MPEEGEQEKGKGQRRKLRFEEEIVSGHVFLLKSNINVGEAATGLSC